jgi:hypothetical protein
MGLNDLSLEFHEEQDISQPATQPMRSQGSRTHGACFDNRKGKELSVMLTRILNTGMEGRRAFLIKSERSPDINDSSTQCYDSRQRAVKILTALHTSVVVGDSGRGRDLNTQNGTPAVDLDVKGVVMAMRKVGG